MSNIAGTHISTNGASELAPLRAKSGWIIALGVVYVLAGLIALGSVVFATVVTVFVVGVMMADRRRCRGYQCLPDQDLGQISALASAWRHA